MIYNESKFNLDWEIKALNQLGEFRRGKSKHRPRNDKKLFINGIYPLIQTGEISAANLYISNHSVVYNDFGLKQSMLWRENTLCITIAANIAETALLGYPMCFPDSVVGFNAFKDESSELFMHYVFTYIKKSIQNSASGSIQDNINIDFLTSLKFRIPSKPYQDKVTKILSSLDFKIELNNRINAELEAMAKTLYDYWFVQFDFPNEEGKPYKSSGGTMIWNEELKREIPEGWEVLRLGEICNANENQLSSTINLDFIHYLDTSNITKNIINNVVRIDDLNNELPSRARRIVHKNDIVYSTVRPNQEHYGIIKKPLENMIVSTGFSVISHKTNALINDFIYCFLSSKTSVNHLQTIAETSVSSYPSINTDDILNLKIAISRNDDSLILEISKKLNIFNNMIFVNQSENQQLAELRDWLLPMLMNGQVKVQ